MNFNEKELINLRGLIREARILPTITDVSEELGKYVGKTKYVIFEGYPCGLTWFILEDNNWDISAEHLEFDGK